MENKNIDASIVIPAFNEEAYIKACLESISKLETKLNFEVILVDNNSTDKTVEVAQKFANGINLRIIKESKQGRGAARAIGFKEAQGKIILSTDADATFDPNWLDILVAGIKGKIVATTTTCKITDCSALTNLIFNFIHPAMTVIYGAIFGNCWLFGFSFAIYKSVYDESEGFDPNLQAQEDFDLGYKICKLGKIKFINKQPLIVSGRRFKNGLLAAFYEYISTFITVIILKRKNAYLDNPR